MRNSITQEQFQFTCTFRIQVQAIITNSEVRPNRVIVVLKYSVCMKKGQFAHFAQQF